MKCFYHESDLDGHCSGALVKLVHKDCEMYPFQYGDDVPWDDLHRGETIYIVDACFTGSEMEQLIQGGADVIWIDHHKTSIEEVKNVGLEPKGLRDTTKAACELTWEYLHPGVTMPRSVKLLGRYDVWDHSDEDVLPFQYGLRMFDTHPVGDNLDLWALLINSDNTVNTMIYRGRAVYLYQTQINERLSKSYAFDLEWEGHTWIAANLPGALGGSKILDSVYDPLKHDGMILFMLNKDGEWIFSLRSDKRDVDVSEIAKQYGGGGHPGAAGFKRGIPPFPVLKR